MRRNPYSKTTMGGGQARYVQKYESDQCEPGSTQARMVQIDMLRTLAESPDLQFCGFVPFQKLTMRHNGESWIIELEATGSE